MDLPRLRAIVLDNDETTGSYMIVFAFLRALAINKEHSYSELSKLFKRLAFWMFKYNVFRPGIRRLLRKIRDLKQLKSVDAIIMYTNQQDGDTEIVYTDDPGPYHDFINKPAHTIAYMMETVLEDKLFDHILTRDPEQLPEKDGSFPKTFNRIFKLYSNYAKDLSNIIFIDDYACPEFIRADGIEKLHKDAWYCIAPYTRNLSEVEIRDCIEYCFKDPIDREIMFHRIYKYYRRSMIRQREPSAPCEITVHELCDTLDYKFLYKDIFKKIFDESKKDKTHLKILHLLEHNG
jgi:hypothetical protein